VGGGRSAQTGWGSKLFRGVHRLGGVVQYIGGGVDRPTGWCGEVLTSVLACTESDRFILIVATVIDVITDFRDSYTVVIDG